MNTLGGLFLKDYLLSRRVCGIEIGVVKSKLTVNDLAVRELDVDVLPVRVVGDTRYLIVNEVRAKEENELVYLHLAAEVEEKFKVVSRAARPRMVGVRTVSLIIHNSVYRVALIEARILSRYEVCRGVREVSGLTVFIV